MYVCIYLFLSIDVGYGYMPSSICLNGSRRASAGRERCLGTTLALCLLLFVSSLSSSGNFSAQAYALYEQGKFDEAAFHLLLLAEAGHEVKAQPTTPPDSAPPLSLVSLPRPSSAPTQMGTCRCGGRVATVSLFFPSSSFLPSVAMGCLSLSLFSESLDATTTTTTTVVCPSEECFVRRSLLQSSVFQEYRASISRVSMWRVDGCPGTSTLCDR